MLHRLHERPDARLHPGHREPVLGDGRTRGRLRPSAVGSRAAGSGLTLGAAAPRAWRSTRPTTPESRKTESSSTGQSTSTPAEPCNFSRDHPVPARRRNILGRHAHHPPRRSPRHGDPESSTPPATSLRSAARSISTTHRPARHSSYRSPAATVGAHRTRLTSTWQDPPQPGTAPIAGASYQLCSADGSGKCSQGSSPARGITSLSHLTVPAAGDYELRVWLTDAAGNADKATAPDPVHLRFDDQPPRAHFLRARSQRPDQDRAVYQRRRGRRGRRLNRVQGRPRKGLASRCRQVLQGADLVAHIDDAAPAKRGLRPPSDRGRSGRQPARDHHGRRRRAGHDHAAAAHRDASRRRRAGSPPLRARSASASADGADQARPRRPTARSTHERGRLARCDHDGPGASNSCTSRGAGWTPLATLQTSRTGRFSYVIRRGVSRTIRFHYPGTPIVRTSDRDVNVLIQAYTTFGVNHHRAIAGETVRFHGRVHGGHLPPERQDRRAPGPRARALADLRDDAHPSPRPLALRLSLRRNDGPRDVRVPRRRASRGKLSVLDGQVRGPSGRSRLVRGECRRTDLTERSNPIGRRSDDAAPPPTTHATPTSPPRSPCSSRSAAPPMPRSHLPRNSVGSPQIRPGAVGSSSSTTAPSI